MKVGSIAVAVALAAAVAGCTGVRIYEPLDGQNYYDGAFEYATRDGEIDTVVLGSPAGPASADFAEATATQMKGATPGRVVTFRPVPWTAPDDRRFRIVALFNGKPPFVDSDLCQNGPGIGVSPGTGLVSMHAAFCQGGHLISSAHGLADNLNGPGDPQFRELVRGVAFAMIPYYDKDRVDGGGGGEVQQ